MVRIEECHSSGRRDQLETRVTCNINTGTTVHIASTRQRNSGSSKDTALRPLTSLEAAAASMDTLSRSRSHRRLYSGGVNNTATQVRGSIMAMGRPGYSSNNSSNTVPQITEELHPALVLKYRKAGQNLTDAAAQAEWANKRWVWVEDAALGYVAGWIISEENDMAQVACVDDKVSS